ncbi:MAG: prenyltransferase [Candidatus Omnitrophica bacterium]|nr:prenyltransferase [Candidatus Omnitrophota bacterium]
MIRNIIRALRLPFISASALPFIFGSLIKKEDFNFLGFSLGLSAVIATHLSANLINDYADSKSGADWQDKNFYKFFGGSKLIQEKVLSEGFYLKASILFLIISFFCILLLALNLKSLFVFVVYLPILFLAWSYSARPFQFSYRRKGEAIIFLLFGPVPVMGGYFIQTGIFPDFKSFILSLPLGFLTTAILFANEVPDFKDDGKVRKINWVSFVGEKQAFLLYYLLIFFSFFTIIIGILFRYLHPLALLSAIGALTAVKAAEILRVFPGNKKQLITSSRLTIAAHTTVSLILILAVIL